MDLLTVIHDQVLLNQFSPAIGLTSDVVVAKQGHVHTGHPLQ
jgi:hypothetical protein